MIHPVYRYVVEPAEKCLINRSNYIYEIIISMNGFWVFLVNSKECRPLLQMKLSVGCPMVVTTMDKFLKLLLHWINLGKHCLPTIHNLQLLNMFNLHKKKTHILTKTCTCSDPICAGNSKIQLTGSYHRRCMIRFLKEAARQPIHEAWATETSQRGLRGTALRGTTPPPSCRRLYSLKSRFFFLSFFFWDDDDN